MKSYCGICGESGHWIDNNDYIERHGKLLHPESLLTWTITEGECKVPEKAYCQHCGFGGFLEEVREHVRVVHNGGSYWDIEVKCKSPDKMSEDKPVLAERLSIPQEESNRILCIGHKVNYEGTAYVISDIRIWHDLDLDLPGDKRFHILCDLAGIIHGRRIRVNVEFSKLKMWEPEGIRSATTKPLGPFD